MLKKINIINNFKGGNFISFFKYLLFNLWRNNIYMYMTFAEKILAKYSGEKSVIPGQIVTVHPDHLLVHDNAAAIIKKITSDLEKYGVYSKDLLVIVLDHVIPAASEKIAFNHRIVRDFVKKYGIKNFYDIGVGVCHQVMVEKGLALPGMLLLGSDSHTCSYGAVGAFSSGIDRTEAASLILSGETWLKVPNSVKMSLLGKFDKGVYAKDLVLHIIGDISADGANYCSVEYHGDVNQFSVDDRFVICNMGVEMGAKNSVFCFDDITENHLNSIGVSKSFYKPVYPDENACYSQEFIYDLGDIVPVVACPHSVDNVKPVSDVLDVSVQQCLIGTCTNGRLSDLEVAAKILKGKKVHSDVRLLILPASKDIFEKALDKGVISILVKSGAVVLPPGCGPCLGAHQGCLAPGEVCISTANRNFKGRMGCNDADIYLASPATVAVSAITGKISDPREVL
jgi:homoaconitate hydratase family protein